MPEGDTVWLAARRMHETMAGRTLVRTEFRVPQLATADLAGQTVTEVASRGKHLLTRTNAGLTLHTHFRMDGTWPLYRSGSRWSGGPSWQVRAVLSTAEWDAVGYRLPVIELIPTGDEGRAVGHLGPDLLGADWNEVEALRRLLYHPEREIGPALLDQRNLAGIGTIYRTELCFLTGYDPRSPVAVVTDPLRMVRLAHQLL